MIARRNFVALGVSALAPLRVFAQPAKKAKIGFLSGNPPADTAEAFAGFKAKLRDLGRREGDNLTIEVRYADGNYGRLEDLVNELIRLNVDVLFTYGTPASLVAKSATKTVPIVFGGVADAIGAGLVPSLRNPPANVTGVTTNSHELTPKRLSLLKEAIPGLARVGVLGNSDFRGTAAVLAETTAAAKKLGLTLQVTDARTVPELNSAFAALSKGKVTGLVVLPDPFFIVERQRIADLAKKARIATMFHLRQFSEAGGLLSYGTDYLEAFQQAAVLVDKVLKGAKPTNLPVEQPWHYRLVVNMKTARALGLKMPKTVLLQADEVIE